MKGILKRFFKNTFLHLLWKKYWEIRDYYTRPIVFGPASDSLKHKFVLEQAKSKDIKILVETGTFVGEMIMETKHYFDKIYSIEIDQRLYKIAKKRFKEEKQIIIKRGDSANLISQILPAIKSPVIFWLDAHYSGGVTSCGSKQTPIMEELLAIFRFCKEDFIILIDDARLFNGLTPDYPSKKELRNFIKENHFEYKMNEVNDIFVIEK